MLDKSVQMLLAEIPGVRLGESLWDVSLFLFYKPLGLVVNLTTLLLLVVTIFSQLVSLLVVFRLHETVRDHGASLQSDFALWRRATDPETVHAVCNRNASLSSSFLQASTYDTHNGYTESFFGESPVFFVGTATSCLLCSAWVVTVLKKLGCVVDHVLSMWPLTLSRCTYIQVAIVTSGTSQFLQLKSIPRNRAVWFFCVCTIQCVIALSLLVVGLLWLSKMTDIADLLIHGVVLAYIVDFDELILKFMIPSRLSTLIRSFEPLPPVPMTSTPLGKVDVRNVTLTIAGVPCLALLLVLIHVHSNESLEIQNTLCGD